MVIFIENRIGDPRSHIHHKYSPGLINPGGVSAQPVSSRKLIFIPEARFYFRIFPKKSKQLGLTSNSQAFVWSIALAKSAQASFAAANSAISRPPSVRGIHNLAGSIADPKPRRETHHPGGNPGVNRESISHRRHPILVAFLWDLTKETIDLPLGSPRGRKGEPEIPSASQRPSCFSEGSICASTCRCRSTSLIRITHTPRITIGP